MVRTFIRPWHRSAFAAALLFVVSLIAPAEAAVVREAGRVLEAMTRPGDYVLTVPGYQLLYFLFDRRNPTAYPHVRRAFDRPADAVAALVNRNAAVAAEAMAAFVPIGAFMGEIEEECLAILSAHPPVATDVRFVLAVLRLEIGRAHV